MGILGICLRRTWMGYTFTLAGYFHMAHRIHNFVFFFLLKTSLFHLYKLQSSQNLGLLLILIDIHRYPKGYHFHKLKQTAKGKINQKK